MKKHIGMLVLTVVSMGLASCSNSSQDMELDSKKKDLEAKMTASYAPGSPMVPSPAAGKPMAACKIARPAAEEGPALAQQSYFKKASADFRNDEEYGRIIESDFLAVKQNPFSTFSIDVDTAAYANVRRYINQANQLPPADAVRTEELVNYFHYDYPQPKNNDPFTVCLEVGDCPWAPTHKLAHIGLQGKEISQQNLPPSNIVFLLDVSGSMEDENKLPLLKRSLAMMVEKLRPQDRVSIVTYAGSSGLVLPATPGSDKKAILDSLESLQSGGGTAGGEGIVLAYNEAAKNFIKGGNNRVVLATDGDFNVGVSSDEELEKLIEEKRKSGVFLTVLGFGSGNYKDEHMETLADKGNGNHAYIDSLNEAKKVLVNEFGGTMFTIAKDVKLQVEFNPTLVKGYRLLGYENRMLAAEDFNDDKKDAGELGSGHTVTALYEIIPSTAKETVRDDVDASRYQKTIWAKDATPANDELMCVKLRYKEPTGSTSKKLSFVAYNKQAAQMTNNFRWSAAVAEYSLLLRHSKYKGKANYGQVLQLASSAASRDKDGYRAEFIDMVKRSQSMDSASTVSDANLSNSIE